MEVEKIEAQPKLQRVRNVGIYCRVSTSEYDQMNSLGTQISGLIDYARKMKWAYLTDIYVDICSGRRGKERNNLNRLIADCRKGRINYVLVKSVSRFSRDTAELLILVRKCREMHVTVYFQNENINSDSPDSELYLSLLGSVAQAESDGKSQNIKWGISEAKENPDSKFNNRKFYGYDHDANGKLVVNEEQAAVVKEIYSLYLGGKSVLKIIDYLKEKGIPSPRGNEVWPKHSIEVILSEERYTGRVVLSRTPQMIKFSNEHHPAIIDRKTFEAVTKMQEERSNVETRKGGKIVRKKTRYKSS